MRYWIVKTEPSTYSWEDLEKAEVEVWDGIRNFQARNFLLRMEANDPVLVYHSGSEKSLVGLAEVAEGPFPDPKETDWVAVKLRALQPLNKAVTLNQIKEEPLLSDITLLKQARLSVHPLSQEAFDLLHRMGS